MKLVNILLLVIVFFTVTITFYGMFDIRDEIEILIIEQQIENRL